VTGEAPPLDVRVATGRSKLVLHDHEFCSGHAVARAKQANRSTE